MRCTGSLGSGFQHFGCGQHGFKILQNPSKLILCQSAVIKRFDKGMHLLA